MRKTKINKQKKIKKISEEKQIKMEDVKLLMAFEFQKKTEEKKSKLSQIF